ncbi:PQQ-binding-like beta-propeller repeat protein [Spiractinospora alimapuensis]|nr:PQQ-binding-like beta-propeller repeat protein [Spiractinospora alimapuensis]QVQ54082.1 PQQ-binding-like beta-propeller repeat protein [Spiractinospora alimapuensis]
MNGGEIVWCLETEGAGWRPTVASGVVHVGSADRHLHAVDVDT